MKTEYSCGAVVFTRVDGEIKYVVVQQLSGHYGFPKGHMEDGENEFQTAKREVFEEVGLTPVFLRGFIARDKYLIFGKQPVVKKVAYFLAEYRDQVIRPQKEELLEARCVSYAEAMRLFRFESCKRILREADEFLRTGKKTEKKKKEV